VGGFERYFVPMATERARADPLEWALQPLPEGPTVDPPINPQSVREEARDHVAMKGDATDDALPPARRAAPSRALSRHPLRDETKESPVPIDSPDQY
jgi:hypothetical protein